MNKKEFLAAEDMGLNFTYPEDYVKFLLHMEDLNDTSWWLIGKSEGFFETCYTVVNEIFGSKKLLIPFAKWDEPNVLACFDENHRVFLHVGQEDLSDKDWENAHEYESFTAWLEWIYEEDPFDNDDYESTRTIIFKNEFLAAHEMDLDFVYPSDYVEFLNEKDDLSDTEWSLIGAKIGYFERCFRIITEVKASKRLFIPFADWGDSSSIAYFDQNHRVYIIFGHTDLYDESVKIKSFDSFTDWLEWIRTDDIFKK